MDVYVPMKDEARGLLRRVMGLLFTATTWATLALWVLSLDFVYEGTLYQGIGMLAQARTWDGMLEIWHIYGAQNVVAAFRKQNPYIHTIRRHEGPDFDFPSRWPVYSYSTTLRGAEGSFGATVYQVRLGPIAIGILLIWLYGPCLRLVRSYLRRRLNRCLSCGYDLRGHILPAKCPECGVESR